MGVCAGIADYFGVNVAQVRIIAIIVLICLNVLTIVLYIVLGFILPVKPEQLCDLGRNEENWQHVLRSANDSIHYIHQRFCKLDARLQCIENYVTSDRYELDRQFRELGK